MANYKTLGVDEAAKKYNTLAPTIKSCREFGLILTSHIAQIGKRGNVVKHLFWVRAAKGEQARLWTHEELKGLLYQYKLHSNGDRTT